MFRDDLVSLEEWTAGVMKSTREPLRIQTEVAGDISSSPAILNTLVEHDFDLVVMGTHGFLGLDHFLLGNISEWVLLMAPGPVITMKPEDGKSTANPGEG